MASGANLLPRRNLVLLCTGMGISFVAQTMLLLAVPLRALELGVGPATVGVLLAAPFSLPMLLAIPLGRLVTRAGARRTMMIGAAGFTVGPWVAVYVGGLTGLLVTQLIVGLMQIFMGLSAQSFIASLGKGGTLERFFGWYTTSVSVGQLLGPLVGGALIDLYGTRAVFPIIGTIPLVALACAASLRGAAGAGRRTNGPLLGYRTQGALLRSNPAVQVSILVTIAMMFTIGAHAAFFPVYLEGLGASASFIGLLVSLRALTSTAVRPFMATLIARLGGRFRTVTFCMLAAAIGLAGIGMTEQAILLGLLVVLMGLAVGLAQPLTMVVLADHVPPEDRPSALGMRLTVNQGAQVLGPLLLGGVAQVAGYTAMFAVGGVMLLALWIVVLQRAPSYSRLQEESS